jgi:hypothetical protein
MAAGWGSTADESVPDGAFTLSRTAQLLEIIGESWQGEARSWVQRCELLLMLRDADPPQGDRASRAPDHEDGLVAELALTLNLSETAAQALWAEAAALAATPHVAAAARVGRLNVPQAKVVLELVAPVLASNPAAAEHVLTLLLGDRPSIGDPVDLAPPRLREWLRYRITRVDAEGVAARRKERVKEQTGLRLRALDDGLAQLVLTGPVDRVLALHRTLGLLRDELVPRGTLDPAVVPDSCQQGDPLATELTAGERMLTAIEQAVHGAARAHGIAPVGIELQLLLPARADGYRVEAGDKPLAQPEPLTLVLDPAGLQELLAAQARAEALRRPPSDPPPSGGEPPDGGGGGGPGPGTSRGWDSGGRPSDGRDSGGRPSEGEPPETADGHRARDDRRPMTAGPPAPIELLGYGPLDPAYAAQVLFQDPLRTAPAGQSALPRSPAAMPQIVLRRLLVDHRVGIAAVDDAPIPLDRAHDTPLPQPPPDTDSYRFTAAQQRVLRTRDRTCAFPGCGRRARRCDLDHLRPFPAGPTSVGNAQPACRRDHLRKHHGWQVHRFRDGSTCWVGPSGREYLRRPT